MKTIIFHQKLTKNAIIKTITDKKRRKYSKISGF